MDTLLDAEAEPRRCWNTIILLVGSDLQQLCHAIAAFCRDDAELRGKARARGARPGGGDYAHQQLGRGGAARWPRTITR